MTRAQRKLEHIKYALALGDGPCSTHFNEIRFLHNCLPEINPADINLSTDFLGKQLRLPFFIDAITGGTDAVTLINTMIAQVAAKLGLAMAVGSQYGAVRTGQGLASYEVIRKYNPDGVVLANTSALATPQEAQAAVDMLAADGLEIHLNAAQEIFMTEGDKDYSGLLDNILRLRQAVTVPIIVKETGCGIAAAEYQRLLQEGITLINCAGAGGTNFPAIEAGRAQQQLSEDFLSWGQPTAWSLLDGAMTCPQNITLLASGGLRTAGDVAKAFALGADLVGMSGNILQLLQESTAAAEKYLLQLAEDLKIYLALLGCLRVEELRQVPLIFTGATMDYLHCRGYREESLSQSRRQRLS